MTSRASLFSQTAVWKGIRVRLRSTENSPFDRVESILQVEMFMCNLERALHLKHFNYETAALSFTVTSLRHIANLFKLFQQLFRKNAQRDDLLFFSFRTHRGFETMETRLDLSKHEKNF